MFIEVTAVESGKRLCVNVNHIRAVQGCIIMVENGYQIAVKEHYDEIKALIAEASKKGGIVGWQFN